MVREKLLLESPVFSIETALKAEEFGVDRIELCASFHEGGETPGAGMLKFLKKHLSIPVYVMIRPRGGDFFYSENEISAMGYEIEILDSHGADGFVFGALKDDGSVNISACKKLVKIAGSKPCTFHRAIDVCSNPMEAIGKIIDCGFNRILTSGGHENVSKGIAVILEMLEKAGDEIIIMPGGGLEPGLLGELKKSQYLKEVHASCKIWEDVPQNSIEEKGTGTKKRVTISREIVQNFKLRLRI